MGIRSLVTSGDQEIPTLKQFSHQVVTVGHESAVVLVVKKQAESVVTAEIATIAHSFTSILSQQMNLVIDDI